MNFEEMTKDDLVLYIKSLNEDRTGKYGMVWDREKEPEKIVVDCNKKIPILSENSKYDILSNSNNVTNLMIKGDNFHSLSVLNYTHNGRIDVIYIDPPYNTKNKDFIYNDRYVDPEDGYRHSKWLNFMDKRLKLAKELLSENGVMYISIDDNEFIQLKMLCNSIFGEANTDVMIWRKSGVGRDGKMKNTTTFRKDHEYIIVCYNGEKILNKIYELPNFINTYPNPDKDPRGPYKAGSISKTPEASNTNHKNYYTVVSPSGKKITRQFDISKEEFDILNNDILINADGKKVSRIYWGKNDDAVPSIKTFINEYRSITPYSMLLNKGTTTEGTKELNRILGGNYTAMRPKPSILIKTLIQLASNKNSIILDFFAGSGTTGQAVLELNREDGGNRSFILCTNNEVDEKIQNKFMKENDLSLDEFIKVKNSKNKKWKKVEEENGIFTSITYPRINNIINGYYLNDKSVTNLYTKPITFKTLIKDNNLLTKEINGVLNEYKEKFDDIETKINDNSIIINGVNKKQTFIEGISSNVKTFSTDFVNNSGTKEQLYYDLTEKCIPMLCVKENTHEIYEQNEEYIIYTNRDKTKYACVYFDMFGTNYDDFIKKIEKIKEYKSLYIFSLNNYVNLDDLLEVENYNIEAIPYRILELYKKIIEIGMEK